MTRPVTIPGVDPEDQGAVLMRSLELAWRNGWSQAQALNAAALEYLSAPSAVALRNVSPLKPERIAQIRDEPWVLYRSAPGMLPHIWIPRPCFVVALA